MSYLEDFFPRNQFILDYLMCSSFIQNYYYKSNSEENESYMTALQQKERLKYWIGHPGRVDFFAKNEGEYYCIDSKVDSFIFK